MANACGHLKFIQWYGLAVLNSGNSPHYDKIKKRFDYQLYYPIVNRKLPRYSNSYAFAITAGSRNIFITRKLISLTMPLLDFVSIHWIQPNFFIYLCSSCPANPVFTNTMSCKFHEGGSGRTLGRSRGRTRGRIRQGQTRGRPRTRYWYYMWLHSTIWKRRSRAFKRYNAQGRAQAEKLHFCL